MKNRIKTILGLACICFLCLGATACTKKTKVDEYQKQGYMISVTYDANGGKFLDREGVKIMDMFKPSVYEKDSDGKIHIKLLEPTSSERPSSGSDSIKLTKSDHFFAGWYKTREPKKNADGKIIDEKGRVLEEVSGKYYYKDKDGKQVQSTPDYNYSDYWDFENDRIDYADADGVVEMTLYAGWVQYYQFDYYYMQDGNWTKYGSTYFDYKTAMVEGSAYSDSNTIWLPDWSNGAMNYKYKYQSGTEYIFPQVENTTFSKAYTDEQMTTEITASLKHHGSLDIEHGAAIDRIQNVYVVFEQGVKYRIETAEQLSSNGNPNGIYEILKDLDFTNVKWPNALSTATFTGKMESTEGNTFKIKNVTFSYGSLTAKTGGLFGTIADGATVKNLTFENITFDLGATGMRLNDTAFGLFAGYIEDEADVSGITVGGLFKIGTIFLGNNYQLNLVANGNTDGITSTKVNLQIYGQDLKSYYKYTIDPTTVTVKENGDISLTFVTLYKGDQPSYDINIDGGNL